MYVVENSIDKKIRAKNKRKDSFVRDYQIIFSTTFDLSNDE